MEIKKIDLLNNENLYETINYPESGVYSVNTGSDSVISVYLINKELNISYFLGGNEWFPFFNHNEEKTKPKN